MATFTVGVKQGYQVAGDSDTVEVEATNAMDIPASDEEQQWTIWKEIVGGYENNPHWKVDARMYGYVRFRHRDMPSLITLVYTTLQ